MHYCSGSSDTLSIGSQRCKMDQWQGGTGWPATRSQCCTGIRHCKRCTTAPAAWAHFQLAHGTAKCIDSKVALVGQPLDHNVAPVFVTANDALLLWQLGHTFNWLTALQNGSMARRHWLASHSITMLHRYSSLQTMHYFSGSSDTLSIGSRRGKRHRWQGGTGWPLANDQPLDHNVAQEFVTANDALQLWQLGHIFNWLTARQNALIARWHWLASHSITMLHRYL